MNLVTMPHLGTQGFNLICLLIIISQHKCLVNPNFQERLSFAYGWHITSQSLGLSNSLSFKQRTHLLIRAGLLRVLSAKLFRSPRPRNLKHLLRRCLSQKVQSGITLDILFSLSSQFVVRNPVQGKRISMCFKYAILLKIPETSFPYEDVDFTDFDPSFRDFLKELVLVSEIMRLFRTKNFVLQMILDTMLKNNLENNLYWIKYACNEVHTRDLISFGETFSRLNKLYEFDETLQGFAPIFDYSFTGRRRGYKQKSYPFHDAALVVFSIDLLKSRFVDFHNFCKKIDESQLAPDMLYHAFLQLRKDGLTLIQLPLSASIVPSHQRSDLSVIIEDFSSFIINPKYRDFLQYNSNRCLSNKHSSSRDCTEYMHECTSSYVRFMLILTTVVEMIQSKNAHFFQLLLLWQDAQNADQSDDLFQSDMVNLLNDLKQQSCSRSEQFRICQSNLTMMVSFTKFEHNCIYDMLTFLFQYLSKPRLTKYLTKHMKSQTDTSSFFESLDIVIRDFEKSRHSIELTKFRDFIKSFDATGCVECRKYR